MNPVTFYKLVHCGWDNNISFCGSISHLHTDLVDVVVVVSLSYSFPTFRYLQDVR